MGFGWKSVTKAAQGAAQATGQQTQGNVALAKALGGVSKSSVITKKNLKEAGDQAETFGQKAKGVFKQADEFLTKYALDQDDFARKYIRGTGMMSRNMEELDGNVKLLGKNAVQFQKTAGLELGESTQIMSKLGHEFELSRERTLKYQSSFTAFQDTFEHAGDVMSTEMGELARKAAELTMATGQNFLGDGAKSREEARKQVKLIENAYVENIALVPKIIGVSHDMFAEFQKDLLSVRLDHTLEDVDKMNRLIAAATTDLNLSGEAAIAAMKGGLDSFLLVDKDEREEYARKLLAGAALQEQAGYEFGKYTKQLTDLEGTDVMAAAHEIAALSGGNVDAKEMMAHMVKFQTSEGADKQVAGEAIQEAVKKAQAGLIEQLHGDTNFAADLVRFNSGTMTDQEERFDFSEKYLQTQQVTNALGTLGPMLENMKLVVNKEEGLLMGTTKKMKEDGENLTELAQKEIAAINSQDNTGGITGTKEQEFQMEGDKREALAGLADSAPEYRQINLAAKEAISFFSFAKPIFTGILGMVTSILGVMTAGKILGVISSTLAGMKATLVGVASAAKGFTLASMGKMLVSATAWKVTAALAVGTFIGTVADKWIGDWSAKFIHGLTGEGRIRADAGKGVESAALLASAARGEMSRDDAKANIQAQIEDRKAELEKEKGRWFTNQQFVDTLEMQIKAMQNDVNTLTDEEKFTKRQEGILERDREAELAAEETTLEQEVAATEAAVEPNLEQEVAEATPVAPELSTFEPTTLVAGGPQQPIHPEGAMASATEASAKIQKDMLDKLNQLVGGLDNFLEHQMAHRMA